MDEFEIGIDKQLDELFKFDCGFPIEIFFCFRIVSDEDIDFAGSEVSLIDLDEQFSIGLIEAFFLGSMAFPGDFEAEALGSFLNEFANGVSFRSGEDKIIGLVVL